jgi:general secretion pathway protein B
MSLILEALKKSEAERQLGRAPGLMTPMSAKRGRRGLSPWWGIGALAVMITAGATWLVSREAPMKIADPPLQPVAAPSVIAAAPTENVIAPEPATPASSDAPPSAPEQSATAPITANPPQEPIPAPSPALMPSDPEFPSVERESLPVSPPATPKPPTVAPAPLEPRKAIAPVEAIASPSPVETAPLPTVDATPAPAATPPEPELESLPALGELLPVERDALPALKMTMHVYNAEPDKRFVLIDGHRHREGDRLAPSLTLSEIRRDGAVLDFNGRRFLIRRP